MSKFATLLLLPALVACQSMSGGGESSEEKTTMAESKSAAPSRPTSAAYDLRGFAVYEEEGRLWVYRDGSSDHRDFLEKGEPAKRVTMIGVGPDGRTVMGADGDVVSSYVLASRYESPGFAVFGDDGRLWVFREKSEALDEFLAQGEPAKRVTLVGAGPEGRTVMGPDRETLEDFLREAVRQ